MPPTTTSPTPPSPTLDAAPEADRRTRRRVLEAALDLLRDGLRPGLLEAATRAAGCARERVRPWFGRDEDLVLAVYERLAADLESRVDELPAGTVAARFHAAFSAKLALVAPYRAPLARLVAAALDPGGELGVVSERTEVVRARVQRVFAAVVLGATDRPAADAVEPLARALYGLHLGLLLVWTQDATPGARATAAALDLARDLLAMAGPLLATPMARFALERVDGVARPFLGAATDPAATATAGEVLRRLFRHRRLLPGAGACGETPCDRCLALHLATVRRSVLAGEPVHLVLPAFPAKSPSPKKTLGPLPDLAEERALAHLQGICDEIAAFYPPGARVTICSDGGVFGDLVGVSDGDVAAYGRGIDAMMARLGARALDRFRLEDLYEERDPAAMRRGLVAHYADPVAALEARARAHEPLRGLLDGIERFLFEDRCALEPAKTRSRVRRECHGQAREVVRRSEAWGRLVAECFPRALRLSVHPQGPHAEKIGVLLGDADGAWLTPWHAVALEGADGRIRLVRREEAERAGARLVERDGRPSHFRLASPAGDRSPAPAGLALDRLEPFGLVVTAPRGGSVVAAVAPATLERWVAEHRLVVLRGFAPLEGAALPAFCETLGELLAWEFGAVNQLEARSGAQNYIYTRRAVPLHWDGAFAGRAPRLIVFHCDEAPRPPASLACAARSPGAPRPRRSPP